MKKILAAILLGCAANVHAQQKGDLGSGGCGTVTPPSRLQEIYDFVQHNPAAYAKGTAGVVDTLPLTIHIVGTDAGGGYYSVDNLLKVICQLNDHFAPVGFYYYIKWPLHYINSSDYFIHDYWTGESMMYANNVASTVNVYFVQDPAGNCGYYTYGGDAVAIGKNCAGNNSTTLTHELGHFFSLPHTFSGWENGNTPTNPERVRRSGAGSNCNSAGDGFCDTDADFISARWSCPNTIVKYDANGDLYLVDSSMYMSYSSDICQSRFSNQQMAAMQNNLHNAGNRSGINAAAVPPLLSAMSAPTIVYPAGMQYSNGQKIVWNKVPGAEYYYVSIKMLSGLEKQVAFTADTSVGLTFVPVDHVGYKVTVNPVNKFNLCRNYTAEQTYYYADATGPVVSVPEVGNTPAIRVYPNPAGMNSPVICQLDNLEAGTYALSVMNINGQQMYAGQVIAGKTKETVNITLPGLAGGVYFVRCSKAGTQAVQKLVILQ